MQQDFINEKKNIYFDQHLFAWESKLEKHLFSPREKSHPQTIKLDARINFTAILNNCLQVLRKLFKHTNKKRFR